MNGNEERLRVLLKKWREIEPKADFEAGVWRRIRRAETRQPERLTLTEWMGRLWPRAVLAMTAAVVASAILGSSAALLSVRAGVTVTPGELQFLGAGTLAGSYVKLTSGRTP